MTPLEFKKWESLFSVDLRELKFRELNSKYRSFQGVFTLIGALLVLAFGFRLALTNAELLVAYCIVSVLGCMAFLGWQKFSAGGLPLFPLFLFQQLLLTLLPIARSADSVTAYDPDITFVSSLCVGGYIVAMFFAWRYASRGHSAPSCYPFPVPSGAYGTAKVFAIGQAFLLFAIGSKAATYTGFIWYVFSGPLANAYPVYRTLESVAEMVGALLAGVACGAIRSNRTKRLVASVIVISVFSVAGGLLSSAMLVIAATFIGFIVGRGRLPWLAISVIFGVVGFLHFGKNEMRQEIKSAAFETPAQRLLHLPYVFAMWTEYSLEELFNTFQSETSEIETDDQSNFLTRLDTLQNINFVVNAIRNGRGTLAGASYAMVPQLLVPRFIWTEKPRTHETQARFNLHFGRQQDESETFDTYIAVGPLAEAIGNFGVFFGPLLLGIAFGYSIGFLEKFSSSKLLLSLEGAIVAELSVKVLLSFEMTAAVLLASIFQSCIAIVIGFCILQSLSRN